MLHCTMRGFRRKDNKIGWKCKFVHSYSELFIFRVPDHYHLETFGNILTLSAIQKKLGFNRKLWVFTPWQKKEEDIASLTHILCQRAQFKSAKGWLLKGAQLSWTLEVLLSHFEVTVTLQAKSISDGVDSFSSLCLPAKKKWIERSRKFLQSFPPLVLLLFSTHPSSAQN